MTARVGQLGKRKAVFLTTPPAPQDPHSWQASTQLRSFKVGQSGSRVPVAGSHKFPSFGTHSQGILVGHLRGGDLTGWLSSTALIHSWTSFAQPESSGLSPSLGLLPRNCPTHSLAFPHPSSECPPSPSLFVSPLAAEPRAPYSRRVTDTFQGLPIAASAASGGRVRSGRRPLGL